MTGNNGKAYIPPECKPPRAGLVWVKRGFHEPTNHAYERDKTDKIFKRCHRFLW